MMYFGIFLLLLPMVQGYPFKGGEPTHHPRIPPHKPPSTHISEFTDPDTGLNPFLDLEEGRGSVFGRNIIDEDWGIPADPPFNDLDIVEGSTGRRAQFGPQLPDESKSVIPTRFFPVFEDLELITIDDVTEQDEVTTNKYDATTTETQQDAIEIQIWPNVVIYVAITAGIVVFIVILTIIACWWRRKLKRTANMPTVP